MIQICCSSLRENIDGSGPEAKPTRAVFEPDSSHGGQGCEQEGPLQVIT